jgi:two-component system, NarL family, response regulator LiaR
VLFYLLQNAINYFYKAAAVIILVMMNFNRYKQVIIYGIALALLLFLLRFLELDFIIIHHSFEVYAGAIALLFTLLGIWIALKLTGPKLKVVIEPATPSAGGFNANEDILKELKISSRELEVLTLIAGGLSNQQIADNLFVSLSTVKTHVANLFFKMEVERRTQAIEKAKRLRLIP